MREFSSGQKVRVVDPTITLRGATGVVARLRIKDNGAWVTIEGDCKGHNPFPAGDPRENNVLLYPEQCELVND